MTRAVAAPLTEGPDHVEADRRAGSGHRVGGVQCEHGTRTRRDRIRDGDRIGHGNRIGHGHGEERSGRGHRDGYRHRDGRHTHPSPLSDGKLRAGLSRGSELRFRLQRRQLRAVVRSRRELHLQLQRLELPAELRGQRQLQPRLLGRQLRSGVRRLVHEDLLRQELPVGEFFAPPARCSDYARRL